MLIILTTVPTGEEAETLAEKIVSGRLAACVQILPRMQSIYFWEGKVLKGAEYLLLIKTLDEKFVELEKFIKENHRYDVPEIAAIAADKVSEKYLNWIKDYLN